VNVSIEELPINGAWRIVPQTFPDSRGVFHEVFRRSRFQGTTDLTFDVKQINQSESKKGVIRGIHFADNPPGQAKYISCTRGRIWDVIVDIRVDSPTFGSWHGVELSSDNRQAVFIAEGLGHAFLCLEEGSVVSYLCSEEYNPVAEHQINPLDELLGIDFAGVGAKFDVTEFFLSKQDREASGFKEALTSGILPRI
jgi:dTDP-4-dehydrorhamnose 3,5-epimerase